MNTKQWKRLEEIHHVGYETTQRGKYRISRWNSDCGASARLANFLTDFRLLAFTAIREVGGEVNRGLRR